MKRIWTYSRVGPGTHFQQVLFGMVALLFVTVSACAQPTQTWIHEFPTLPYPWESVHEMVITTDGRVVVVGAWNDMWGILCLDLATGDPLWELSGGDDLTRMTSVVTTDDGTGDIIAGGHPQFDAFRSYLTRVNAQGEIVWWRDLQHSSLPNRVYTIQALMRMGPDKVFACGQINSRPTIGWVNIDNPGVHWARSINSGDGPWTMAMAQYSGTSVLMGGKIAQGNSFNGIVLNMSRQGQLLWAYQTNHMISVLGIASTMDGTVIAAGYESRLGVQEYPARMEGLNANGEFLWAIEQGLDNHSLFYDVCTTDPSGSNDVYVAGSVNEEEDGPNYQLVHKVSSTGEIIWTLYGSAGNSDQNGWTAVEALDNGGLVVAGVRSPDYPDETVVIERYDP